MGRGQRLDLSLFDVGMHLMSHWITNHGLTGEDPESVVAADERAQVRGRAMLVKRLKPLPIEAVQVKCVLEPEQNTIRVRCEVSTTGKTRLFMRHAIVIAP